ncbi:MAG: hypothetical protein MRY83_23385, partial [Flavobacteriales bacterium]|nr:hypothetical protein [Flavobacteriales bacterium]
RFDMNSNSFIISEVDSISKKYNQIKGQNMIGFFKKGALKKVNVKGNGMSIYYAVEKSKKTENDSVKIREESYIGMNRADGEDMDLYIDDNKVKKIVIKKPSPSTLFPLEELKKDDLKLPGFKWRDAERPKKWDDIFYWEEENSNLLGISKNEENEIETLEAQENAKDEVKTSEKSQ